LHSRACFPSPLTRILQYSYMESLCAIAAEPGEGPGTSSNSKFNFAVNDSGRDCAPIRTAAVCSHCQWPCESLPAKEGLSVSLFSLELNHILAVEPDFRNTKTSKRRLVRAYLAINNNR